MGRFLKGEFASSIDEGGTLPKILRASGIVLPEVKTSLSYETRARLSSEAFGLSERTLWVGCQAA